VSHSYADHDSSWVKSFARALEEHDVAVWLDVEQLRPGDAVSDAVEKAMRGSDAIVVVLNPATVSRPSLLWEIGAGIGMRKRLIPILPRDMEGSGLPVPLRNVQSLKRGTPEDTAAIVAATLSD
jgi:hypothetical protein